MVIKKDEPNTLSGVVVKKRGRKSKKELELAQQQQNESQTQTQTQIKENINVIIEETNIFSNSDTIENLINSDDLDYEEENEVKDNNEISTDNSFNKETKPNVILHLKCSLKDLQTNSSINSDIQGFNFNGTNQLAYEIINAQPSVSNQNSNNDIVPITKCVEDDDFDDDKSIKENDIKEVWKKLKQLEHNLHVNNICDKKSACFWCTYEFDNPPVYIPKHFIKDSYHVYGCFCSPECATAHLMEENIDSSSKFERYHLINHIYSKIYDYKKNIKPAPNPFYMLEKYYGNLSIQEYRALLKNERLFLIVDKPLTRILPELHEDNDDFIINNKIIPSNTYQIKKKLQNKQTKNNILTERFGLSQH